jgi:hypothetical protein
LDADQIAGTAFGKVTYLSTSMKKQIGINSKSFSMKIETKEKYLFLVAGIVYINMINM